MSEIATLTLPPTIDPRCRIEARESLQLTHWVAASFHHCLGARPPCGAGVPSLRASRARLVGRPAPLVAGFSRGRQLALERGVPSILWLRGS